MDERYPTEPIELDLNFALRNQTPMAFRSTSMCRKSDGLARLSQLEKSGQMHFSLLNGSHTPPRSDTPSPDASAEKGKEKLTRDTRFWMCIVALMLASFLIVLDLVSCVFDINEI